MSVSYFASSRAAVSPSSSSSSRNLLVFLHLSSLASTKNFILASFLATILLSILHLTIDTICVIIGLNSEQLKRLAVSGRQFQKTARRDIAHVVSFHAVYCSSVIKTRKSIAITHMPCASTICLLVDMAAMETLSARYMNYCYQIWATSCIHLYSLCV